MRNYACSICGHEANGELYCSECQIIVSDKVETESEAHGLMECLDNGTATREDINRYKFLLHKITLDERSLKAREKYRLITK